MNSLPAPDLFFQKVSILLKDNASNVSKHVIVSKKKTRTLAQVVIAVSKIDERTRICKRITGVCWPQPRDVLTADDSFSNEHFYQLLPYPAQSLLTFRLSC